MKADQSVQSLKWSPQFGLGIILLVIKTILSADAPSGSVWEHETVTRTNRKEKIG